MRRDARTDAVGETLRSRVCVIGAGAAGIAAADRLAAKGVDTLLVEAGDEALEGATQRLYAGANIGLPYYDLLSCRLRYFGGTTNHWAGYCRANDPIDYVGRPELGVPAWPLMAETLAPYLSEAAARLEISEAFFDPRQILADRGVREPTLLDDRSPALETKVFQLTQVLRHGPLFGPALDASPHVTRVVNLNAVEIVLDESRGHVDHVVARTTTGKVVTLFADIFFLSCHAIENARLLLASNRQAPEGVGNRYGHVGRYFMEHPHIFASRMIPAETFPAFYDYAEMKRLGINANLSISERGMREHGILSYYCRFNPLYAEPGVETAISQLRAGFMKPFDPDLTEDVATLLGDLGGTMNLVRGRLTREGPRPLAYALEHRIEQAPNPDSRIVLREERDALGVPIADLDWRLSDLDIETFAKGQDIIARELSALGMGRFELETIDRALVEARVEGHYHHIGTTRMSADPSDGVVDANCRVHGLDNLYVGGSSVFTTSGYSGPTMMIMAFAMRAADHITEA